MTGASNLVSSFDAQYAAQSSESARWNVLVLNGNSSGDQFWYAVGDVGLSAAIARADTNFAALKAAADQRLATMQAAHAALSQSLAGLYQVQADATGALYDLYDHYLTSRSPVPPASTSNTITLPVSGGGKLAQLSTGVTVTSLLDTSFLNTRRAQLGQDLTVPRINSVQVTATGTSSFATQVNIAWTAWHPSGTYEYEFQDADPGAASGSLLSNGTASSRWGYRFTSDHTLATTLNRSVTVGARGGAGYLGTGQASYTLSFKPGTAALPSVGGGAGLLTDNTPPTIPVVSFPSLAQRTDTSGNNTAWTNDPTRVAAQWSADDPESGVGLYEYAVWSTPTGTSFVKGGAPAQVDLLHPAPPPVVRPFTGVGGRTDATVGLSMTPGQPLYVAVRATNGQGGVSAPGVSMPLRYDATPPVFPAGATLTLNPAAVPVASTSAASTYAACPVAPPALPGTFPAVTILTPPPVVAWTGTLGSIVTPGATPRVQFTRPDASDPESGISGYYYKVSAQPGDTVDDASWPPASARASTFTASGAPLDYQHQFWITLVSKNTAGSISHPVTYGPFSVIDPTPPTAPAICAGNGSAAGQLAVQLTTPATDYETSVLGYQYRIRTAKGALVRQWPRGTTVDWPAGSTAAFVAQGLLADGQSYVVDVQAINGQNEVSGFVTSGPVLYDMSPPSTPTASVTVTAGIPSLVVNAPADPQSGLTALQWAVGTSATGADVQAWLSSTIPSGGGSVTLPFAVTLPTNTTLWLQIRSVNGTGLVSTMYSTSFSVPALSKGGAVLTPPRLP